MRSFKKSMALFLAILLLINVWVPSKSYAAGSGGDNLFDVYSHGSSIYGFVLDSQNNIYFISGATIQKFNTATGNVIHIAGKAGGSTTNGALAKDADIGAPNGLAIDKLGDLYIADTYGHRILKLTFNGANDTIETIAGVYQNSVSNSCLAGSSVKIQSPTDLVIGVNAAGDDILYFTGSSKCVQSLNLNYGPTNGWPVEAHVTYTRGLNQPKAITMGPNKELYIADSGDRTVRKYDPSTDTLSIVAGISGSEGDSLFSGEGSQATAVALKSPAGVAVDNAGNLYITDSAYHMIFKVNTSGQISRFAGTGTAGTAGNDGPAIDAQLNTPKGLEFGRNGELYVITSNKEVKVVQKGFKVLYNGNGSTGGSAPESKIYNPGTVVTASDKGSLVKTNATFESWNTQADGNGTTYMAGAQLPAPESALTLYAKWKLNGYALNYVAGEGGTITGNLSQVITHGGSGTAVTAKANTGYVFEKWSDGKTTATRTDSNVTGNLNITAQFKELKYKVTYIVNGGVEIPVEDVGVNGYASNPTPTREGHAFKGWFADSYLMTTIHLPSVPIVKDTTVYAKWEINLYWLNYSAGENGTITGNLTQLNLPYGSNGTTVTAVPNSGYVFHSWSDGNTDAIRTDKNVSKNISAGASFVKAYNVTFAVNGGTAVPPQLVRNNGKVTEPGTTREGYDLVGWYSDSAMQIPFDLAYNQVLRDLTLYAKWKIKSYTLTYTAGPNGKVNDAPFVTRNVNHGASGPVVTAEPDQGYVFVKWSDNKTEKSRTDLNVMANINVTATFDLLKHKVSFVSNGGTPVTSQDVVDQSTVELPTSPSKEGHSFDGWYTDVDLNEKFVSTTPITKITTLYAKWKINEYTLNYTANDNGALTGITVQTVVYNKNGTEVTAVPNPGYAFDKWSDEETNATRTDNNVAGNINVTAQFVKLHTVTFNVDGGTPVADLSVANNKFATAPTITKEGYGFAGWYTDSSFNKPFNLATMQITADVILYAKWNINQYTLSYTPGSNGTVSGTLLQENISHGADGTLVTAVPDEGYAFKMWSDGVTSATRTETSVAADINVTAQFVKLHTVSFESGGGNVVADQIIMDNELAATVEMTKDGYSFAGWYLEATWDTRYDITNTPITKDMILYAKWVVLIPGAPVVQSVVPGNTTVTIEWESVAHTTGYQVFMSSTSGAYDPQSVISVGNSVYSYQATDLVNGTTYYFVVKAMNESGEGIASNEVSATPKTVPGAPTDVVATVGNGQAMIQFTAPDDNGGSLITGYKVTSTPGNIVAIGASSPITVTGLTNGTAYTFTVEAINVAGNSAASDVSNAVTPIAPVTPPSVGGGGGGAPTSTTDGKLTLPSGSAGGTKLGDEISVSIPAGATVQELKLTVEQVLNTANLAEQGEIIASPVFELLKNFSDNFKNPVTLTLKFDQTKLNSNQTVAIFYYDEVKKSWVKVTGGKINGNLISVDVDHFTKYAVLAVDKATGELITEKVTEGTTEGATEVSFNDIASHWAAANIKQAVQQGIVKGYTDGTFKPNATVTRAEFAVMLMNALKPTGNGADLSFSDNAKIGAWAQKAIAQAVQANIIKGFSDGTFRPNDQLTRAEMAAIIANALKLTPEANTATGFADDKDIPAWAKGAVGALKKLELVSGKGGNKFDPNATTTRAEAVTVLLKMLEQASK